MSGMWSNFGWIEVHQLSPGIWSHHPEDHACSTVMALANLGVSEKILGILLEHPWKPFELPGESQIFRDESTRSTLPSGLPWKVHPWWSRGLHDMFAAVGQTGTFSVETLGTWKEDYGSWLEKTRGISGIWWYLMVFDGIYWYLLCSSSSKKNDWRAHSCSQQSTAGSSHWLCWGRFQIWEWIARAKLISMLYLHYWGEWLQTHAEHVVLVCHFRTGFYFPHIFPGRGRGTLCWFAVAMEKHNL